MLREIREQAQLVIDMVTRWGKTRDLTPRRWWGFPFRWVRYLGKVGTFQSCLLQSPAARSTTSIDHELRRRQIPVSSAVNPLDVFFVSFCRGVFDALFQKIRKRPYRARDLEPCHLQLVTVKHMILTTIGHFKANIVDWVYQGGMPHQVQNSFTGAGACTYLTN